MWISRQAYQDLKDEITTARAEVDAYRKANEVLEANMNWFRHRLTQTEHERKALVHRILGVEIPAPTFEKVDPVKQFMSDHNINEQDMFRSLSDAEAAKEGVAWDTDGYLVQN